MLIISKYKDYYDGVVGTVGIDKTIVFDRTTEEIDDHKKYPEPFISPSWDEKNNNKLLRGFSFRNKTTKYKDANYFIVGFCGKLYLGFRMYLNEQDRECTSSSTIHYTYEINEFKKYFKHFAWDTTMFDDFINAVKEYDCTELHRKLNTPIFLLDTNPQIHIKSTSVFVINPILKDYEFYKVFDSFTAFQEISMFIGGVLGTGEKSIIEVSDKDKIISRGFDYKWSFRKEPSQK